jgi:hypothetical protein
VSAPVIGFSAEVPKGLNGETFVEIAPEGDLIEISLSRKHLDFRDLIVTHDEARQIIAGLASVIT